MPGGVDLSAYALGECSAMQMAGAGVRGRAPPPPPSPSPPACGPQWATMVSKGLITKPAAHVPSEAVVMNLSETGCCAAEQGTGTADLWARAHSQLECRPRDAACDPAFTQLQRKHQTLHAAFQKATASLFDVQAKAVHTLGRAATSSTVSKYYRKWSAWALVRRCRRAALKQPTVTPPTFALDGSRSHSTVSFASARDVSRSSSLSDAVGAPRLCAWDGAASPDAAAPRGSVPEVMQREGTATPRHSRILAPPPSVEMSRCPSVASSRGSAAATEASASVRGGSVRSTMTHTGREEPAGWTVGLPSVGAVMSAAGDRTMTPLSSTGQPGRAPWAHAAPLPSSPAPLPSTVSAGLRSVGAAPGSESPARRPQQGCWIHDLQLTPHHVVQLHTPGRLPPPPAPAEHAVPVPAPRPPRAASSSSSWGVGSSSGASVLAASSALQQQLSSQRQRLQQIMAG
eukprot:TRINITY_DN25681_c0_g1_i1.p1 TRINITY_DN25681_c0_g1~~TRINITY_DN25681_c0_g1_i1.p1  ORF type:complete len:458 (+),score=61.26 TRINITY_DN25681_c0_g1_i1:88-1461(+)